MPNKPEMANLLDFACRRRSVLSAGIVGTSSGLLLLLLLLLFMNGIHF
jgi:hypothetical protein